MPIVAGVDFGTLSVRVSIVDSERGRLGSGVADYPLRRSKQDPDLATQSHDDQMRALVAASRRALVAAGVDGRQVGRPRARHDRVERDPGGRGADAARRLLPLVRPPRVAKRRRDITRVAHETGLEAIHWCGDTYSSEWGFSKLLHWLRHNPEKRGRFVTALEHCDMVAAVLCGITDPASVPRSVCAMGHKWMWSAALGGLPPESFLTAVDPLLSGVRERITGRFATSDHLAGRLAPAWADRLGLRAGIPIPVGAFDAHWDAVGAGVRLGDVVNVIGTSTCIIAVSDTAACVPGLCGVVPGSVHPALTGIEAGLSATGDIFDAIARRAGTTVAALSDGLERYRAGETGLLHLTWDNGDRTVLVNPELGGVTLGWNLTHTPQDHLFAAIEGTAFHTRIILERMEEHGVPIRRVINGGGIPHKNPTLNAVYASVLGKPILVPKAEVTSLGSAIFAFMAAGAFPTIEHAQDALCPGFDVVEPDPRQVAVYEKLFSLYRAMYFAMGRPDAEPAAIGSVLPALRRLAAEAKQS